MLKNQLLPAERNLTSLFNLCKRFPAPLFSLNAVNQTAVSLWLDSCAA
jgi:hypothetical protein